MGVSIHTCLSRELDKANKGPRVSDLTGCGRSSATLTPAQVSYKSLDALAPPLDWAECPPARPGRPETQSRDPAGQCVSKRHALQGGTQSARVRGTLRRRGSEGGSSCWCCRRCLCPAALPCVACCVERENVTKTTDGWFLRRCCCSRFTPSRSSPRILPREFAGSNPSTCTQYRTYVLIPESVLRTE